MDGPESRLGGNLRLSRLPLARPTSAIPRPRSSIFLPSSDTRSSSSNGGQSGGLDLDHGQEMQPPKRPVSFTRGQLMAAPSKATVRESPSHTAVLSEDQPSVGSTSPTSPMTPKAQPISSRSKTLSAAGTRYQRRTSTIMDTVLTRGSHSFSPKDSDDASALKPNGRQSPTVKHQLPAECSEPSARKDANDPVMLLSQETPSAKTDIRTMDTRPSLTERTIETLSLLSASPATRRRPLSFFQQPGPNEKRRNSSFYSSDRAVNTAAWKKDWPRSSTGRRDGLAHDIQPIVKASKTSRFPIPNLQKRQSAAGIGQLTKPGTTATSSGFAAPVPDTTIDAEKKSSLGSKSRQELLPGPGLSGPPANRREKSRASMGSASKTACSPTWRRLSGSRIVSSRSSSGQGMASVPLIDNGAQHHSSESSSPCSAGDTAVAWQNRKSSAALREMIAKAKAARRASLRQTSANQEVGQAGGGTTTDSCSFLFGLGLECDDPFNLKKKEDPKAKVIKERVVAARTSGRLNIAALGLKQIPVAVMDMYKLEEAGAIDGSWAESVDLTRLVAANNDLEKLEEAMFPDRSPDAFVEDPDCEGNIFGGLETVDLHGNLLTVLPTGFRRLPYLTSLNLSSNCLENSCLEVIFQMTALRDLKLSRNRLSGMLSRAVAQLEALEVLDLHGNRIASLPAEMGQLARLRILDVGENELEEIPFHELVKVPLTELSVKKNRLRGRLIDDDSIESLPLLQSLDASSNQLTHLVAPGSRLTLPAAHAVWLSTNRLLELPGVRAWSKLVTLAADENNISRLPDGFTELPMLRQADLGSNEIRTLPLEIGRMEKLAALELRGNPLRERRLTLITTEELKRILTARLEQGHWHQQPVGEAGSEDGRGWREEARGRSKPASGPWRTAEWQGEVEGEGEGRSEEEEDFATPLTSAPHSPDGSRGQAAEEGGRREPPGQGQLLLSSSGSGGEVVVLSGRGLRQLDGVTCLEMASQGEVRRMQLEDNLLTWMPSGLGHLGRTLSVLCLSRNRLSGTCYMPEPLDLPALREMDLGWNQVRELEPLLERLRAPILEKMDVRGNEVESLPEGGMKQAFPRLRTLLVSNNKLTRLEAAAVQGLREVDASSNEIVHLDPRIGFLGRGGGEGSLERLEVRGNRFRQPRWSVLERGTEATLRWLRGRVPAVEMAAWKLENGRGEGEEEEAEEAEAEAETEE